MRHYTALLFLLLLTVAAEGQPLASFSGGIYFCTSREHAAWMTLRLESVADSTLSYRFRTDSNGHFLQSGIRPGEYVLMCDGVYANMDFSANRTVLDSAQALEIDTIWTMNRWGTPIQFDYFTCDYLPRIPIPNEYARVYARLAEASTKKYYGMWCDDIPMRSLLPWVKVPEELKVCARRGRLYLTNPAETNRRDDGWGIGQSVFVSDDNNQLQPYVSVLENDPYCENRPAALEGVQVPFTQVGIWQAYLLHRTDTWMKVRAWCNGGVCLFTRDALSLIFPTEGRCSCDNYHSISQQLLDSIPEVTTRVDMLAPDTAMVTATYYLLGMGNIEEQHWLAIRSGKTVRFEKQACKVLYRYKGRLVGDTLSW